METVEDTVETQSLERRIDDIIDRLELANVPTAAELDPDNKMALDERFQKVGGVYRDVIPPDVIKRNKQFVMKEKEPEETNTPLLEEQRAGGQVIQAEPTKITTGGKRIPLFKEQVEAAAQQLARLGVIIPETKDVKGESFAILREKKPKTKVTSGGLIRESYKTEDPNIFVTVERRGASDSPATKVKLSFRK